MQAFQQSVHTVVNPSEMFLMKQLIEKAVADNDMFLHSFCEVLARLLSGRARVESHYNCRIARLGQIHSRTLHSKPRSGRC